LTLALKYRPKRFEDLIAQETISKTLAYALDQNKLSHAYLFSGLRGSGKTSTARIFSKALLCSKGPTSSPCEECENCKMANEGTHLDIIEMDAASNRKIDDIRDLIEQTRYKPALGRYKIFIIDEVHMLTKEAFNALLKTLEEPPEFVKFILATTDPLKIPPTIISRTQHFRFKKIPTPAIIAHLEKILTQEKIAYEPQALKLIARSGKGSLRDTLTLLDQAIAFGRGEVKSQEVVKMLGLVDPLKIKELFEKILQQDQKAVLTQLEELSEYEALTVIEELLLFLKEGFLEESLELPLMLYERFFKILSDAKHLLQLSGEDSLVLTLTFLKLIEAVKLKNVEELIEEFEKKPKQPTLNLLDFSPQPKDKFSQLLQKLHQRDKELGECFEKNITFISFNNNILRWRSQATGECKKLLRDSYPVIKYLVQEIFGIDVQIKNEVAEVKEEKKEEETPLLKVNLEVRDLANEPIIQEARKLLEAKKLIIKNKPPKSS